MTENEKQLIHAVVLYAEMVKEQARNKNEFPVIDRTGLEEYFKDKAMEHDITYGETRNENETVYEFLVNGSSVQLTIKYSNNLYQEHYFEGLVAVVSGEEFYFGGHKHE